MPQDPNKPKGVDEVETTEGEWTKKYEGTLNDINQARGALERGDLGKALSYLRSLKKPYELIQDVQRTLDHDDPKLSTRISIWWTTEGREDWEKTQKKI